MNDKNQACVYILLDKYGKFYIGSTNNINRRLHQHFSGHTQTTRNMKDPLLVLRQNYASLTIARKIEKKIKNLKRKDYIEKMVQEGYIKLKV